MLLLVLVLVPPVGLAFGLVIGGLWALLAWSVSRRVRQAQHLTPEAFRESHDALLEAHYEAAQPIPATRAIALAIAGVGVLQLLLMDASIEAGTVSRGAVEGGEWWRLLTAPMLHGGIWHFWMNYGALDSLGRTMETRGVRRTCRWCSWPRRWRAACAASRCRRTRRRWAHRAG